MSVALVARECNLIAAFAFEQRIFTDPAICDSARLIAGKLWRTNTAAFLWRYDGRHKADIDGNALPYRKPKTPASEHPRAVYDACECWEYQCDDLPGFDMLATARLVAQTKRRCIALDPSIID